MHSFLRYFKNTRFFSQKIEKIRPSDIKLISVGGKKNQNIKQKDTQRGPLGDHLKDDPASGDKYFTY